MYLLNYVFIIVVGSRRFDFNCIVIILLYICTYSRRSTHKETRVNLIAYFFGSNLPDNPSYFQVKTISYIVSCLL